VSVQIVPDHEPNDMPAELAQFAAEWDYAAWMAKLAALFGTPDPTPPAAPRMHVTAQMIADIWQDENGPARVAAIVRTLDEPTRNRLAVDWWNLLRRRGHAVSLVEVGVQLCVVERLAA
jgi:hypothetical protein